MTGISGTARAAACGETFIEERCLYAMARRIQSSVVQHHHGQSSTFNTLDKREIECLLYDSHQKGKMMIMIMKTAGSQVDSPVAEGNRKEGGRKMRDLQRHTVTGDVS